MSSIRGIALHTGGDRPQYGSGADEAIREVGGKVVLHAGGRGLNNRESGERFVLNTDGGGMKQ